MSLAISIGQYSDKGKKPANQDFYGALIPDQPLLDLKGISIALADGISSSEVGSLAAQTAIKSFLTDYYGTPDTWPVKTAAHRVIAAANSWLHAQTRQMSEDVDSGYVTTLSVLILKSRVAHIFHVGDSRISRLSGRSLEQLTADHRIPASPSRSYLGRALGIGPNVEVDYRAVPVNVGDMFLLTTDGIHEHVDGATVARLVAENADLDRAARAIAEEALRRGSGDNLTVQIARVDGLADGELGDLFAEARDLPLPPPLEPGKLFDGFRIVRGLHANARSQVFLAEHEADGQLAVIKVPAPEMRNDDTYMQRFMLEDWIARQVASPHTLKVFERERGRSHLYIATEYVDGQTLSQWMLDNPRPALDVVRDIVEQIAKGLRAFHRLELVHQDLRPDNVMIDRTGTVKIIDFGSTKVPGVIEAQPVPGGDEVLGTLQFTAPETLLGLGSTARSDIFSLGVIAYQMLTGALPYGASAARLRNSADVERLRYVPLADRQVEVPRWVDRALEKAVHPDPERRYEVLSEFTHDLSRPGPDFAGQPERMVHKDQLRFWKLLSLVLAVMVVALAVMVVMG
ncbi:MAG TPA: bifunctional protein-serine/threonine kinase/phosphatase [Devosia sp.]